MQNMGLGKTIKVLGIDPALRNFGFCVATIDVKNDKIVDVENLILAKSEDEAGKKVRRNSDDLRRAKSLVEALQEACQGCSLAIAEVPVGSQSARAMASYGICIGVLASCPIGLLEVTPTEVKVNAVGEKTATKQEMIEWAVNQFPKAPWLKRTVKGKETLRNDNEHLADALGAINAGLHSSQWKQLKAFM